MLVFLHVLLMVLLKMSHHLSGEFETDRPTDLSQLKMLLSVRAQPNTETTVTKNENKFAGDDKYGRCVHRFLASP